MIWLCLKMMYTWLCYMFFFPYVNGAESNPMEMECPFWGDRATTFHQIQMEWIGYVDDTW